MRTRMDDSQKARGDGFPRRAVRLSPEELDALRERAVGAGQTINGRIRWLIQQDIRAQNGAK